jgi:hypothetical protein
MQVEVGRLTERVADGRRGIGFGWLQNAWLRRMPA